MEISKSIGLNDNNFNIFAAKHYNNIFYDEEEFLKDIKRFAYIKRLFNLYLNNEDLKERLILNHLVIIFNLWPTTAIPMLFYKLKGYEVLLKTFLIFMQRIPDSKYINIDDINIDKQLLEKLLLECQRN